MVKRGIRLDRIAFWIILSAALVSILFPFYWMIASS